MAKRKRKVDQIIGEKADLGEQLDTNIVTQEELAAEINAEPTIKTIHVGPDDNIESLTTHHYAKGAKAGEVNKHELETCMEMLITGYIHFTGAYHDKRKVAFYKHLAKHYQEFGLIVPLLK